MSHHSRTGIHRLAVALAATATAALVTWWTFRHAWRPGLDWITAATIATFMLTQLSAYICIYGSWIAGSWVLFRRRRKGSASYPTTIHTRTAYVMPIFNEDVDRVAKAIEVMWDSAKRAGLDEHCDFFLLSDTNDATIAAEEDEAIQRLLPLFQHNQGESGRLFLVRRTWKGKFKAGNVENFLEHHGDDYTFMLVLDADSVMLGDTVKRLICRLQASPNTAILQSLMTIFRAATPFARFMQHNLNIMVYLYSAGLNWVLGKDVVHWGHNSLIRIAPFREHAILPEYPGRPPLGGTVLSQDVHEACLLGRAGWQVELNLEVGGSYEEIPANLISFGRRDWRWFQGDWMNCAMVFAKGIRTGQKIWLAYIVNNYLISVVLFTLMVLVFIGQLSSKIEVTPLLIYSIAFTLPVMHWMPKLLVVVLNLSRRRNSWELAGNCLLDIFGSLILGPLLQYQHIMLSLNVLIGRPIGWKSPSRDPDDPIVWSQAARVYLLPTVVSATWSTAAILYAPQFLLVAGPFLFSWLFSIPLSVASSRASLGRWLARRAVFRAQLLLEELEELGELVHTNDCPSNDDQVSNRNEMNRRCAVNDRS